MFKNINKRQKAVLIIWLIISIIPAVLPYFIVFSPFYPISWFILMAISIGFASVFSWLQPIGGLIMWNSLLSLFLMNFIVSGIIAFVLYRFWDDSNKSIDKKKSFIIKGSIATVIVFIIAACAYGWYLNDARKARENGFQKYCSEKYVNDNAGYTKCMDDAQQKDYFF